MLISINKNKIQSQNTKYKIQNTSQNVHDRAKAIIKKDAIMAFFNYTEKLYLEKDV